MNKIGSLCFLAPPFSGHLNPQFTCAKAAQQAGYQVTCITGPRKIETLQRQGLTALSLQSMQGDVLEAIVNKSSRAAWNPMTWLTQIRENLTVQSQMGAELEALWRANTPSLVVTDFVMPIGGIIADRLNIPWITTIPTPFAIENHQGPAAYCGGLSAGPGLWRPARDALARGAIRHFKKMAYTLYRDAFHQLGVGLYRADGTETLYSPYAILGFGIREIEFDRDWPACFRMVGPVYDNPENCPPISYPKGRKTVLVTLGTHLPWAKAEVATHVAAIATNFPDVEFVVSLGKSGEASSDPVQRMGNVSVYPFVPYRRDLVHFDLAIHHGGPGIMYGCIDAQKPSIVIPHDYDQFDFAARMVYHGLALHSPAINHSRTKAHLHRLLNDPPTEALARFKSYLDSYTPEQSFVETVRRLIGDPV